MAEEKLSLHVDSDWKKQAAEEKKKLAEQEAQRRAQQQAAPAPAGVVGGAARGQAPQRGREREMPAASLATLVHTLSTQALVYMGELATRGGEPVLNLDLAKHNIDMLGVLQEKTQGNLTAEEKTMLDSVLYEIRMRFVAVGQQYAQLP